MGGLPTGLYFFDHREFDLDDRYPPAKFCLPSRTDPDKNANLIEDGKTVFEMNKFRRRLRTLGRAPHGATSRR